MARRTLSAAMGLLAAPIVAHGQVVYVFGSTPSDGAFPNSVLMDQAGALYGSTYGGGSNSPGDIYDGGIVFRLTPSATGGGRWTEQRLHEFPASANDGKDANGDLLMDASGALYGVTTFGGAGQGIVFKLSPPAAGSQAWTETILHAFDPAHIDADGSEPMAGLVADATGALYGTTFYGGTAGQGVVYKLTPPVAGQTQWTEQTLHSFSSQGGDGYLPSDRLAIDRRGNLYGAAPLGGVAGLGIIFELSPPAAGQTAWTETILYDFPAVVYGDQPQGVVFGQDGILYGTTAQGGTGTGCYMHCGTVFSLTPPVAAGGVWTYARLHSFTGIPDGAYPRTPVTIGVHGTLYGTTSFGGTTTSGCEAEGASGCGAVFALHSQAAGGGGSSEQVRASQGVSTGSGLYSGLFLGSDGFAYGAAQTGGTLPGGVTGYGTVFRLKAK